MAIKYMESNPLKRVLFAIPDDAEEKLWNIQEIDKEEILYFEGAKKIIIDEEADFDYMAKLFLPEVSETGERIINRFNGLICCDDMGTNISRRPVNILKLFKRRRQPNIDFTWSFHGLKTDVPPAFWTYVNNLILFRTSDPHEYTMECLPENKRDEFLEMYRRVQKISETKPHYCEQLIINSLII